MQERCASAAAHEYNYSDHKNTEGEADVPSVSLCFDMVMCILSFFTLSRSKKQKPSRVTFLDQKVGRLSKLSGTKNKCMESPFSPQGSTLAAGKLGEERFASIRPANERIENARIDAHGNRAKTRSDEAREVPVSRFPNGGIVLPSRLAQVSLR